VGGPATVARTTFNGNTLSGGDAFSGPSGAGLGNLAGTVNVVNATFANNNVSSAGTKGDGGGLATLGGVLNLFNVTSSNNNADDNGDGVHEGSGGGTVSARASIFADACGSAITDGGGNVEAANTCGLAAGSNLDPVLGPLQNNGGTQIGAPADPSPRLTMAIAPGSPALDRVAGNCVDQVPSPIPTDARGLARPVDGDGDGSVNCDAGAFEYAPPPPSVPTPPAVTPPAKKKCKKGRKLKKVKGKFKCVKKKRKKKP
jgi:hypothetical protein